MNHLAEALKRHMQKSKGPSPEMGDSHSEASNIHQLGDSDRAPSLDGDGKGPGDTNVQASQLEPQHPGDLNMHPVAPQMSRTGGTLSPDEHGKIIQALHGVGSPIGRGANTLNERAKMAAIKAKDKSKC